MIPHKNRLQRAVFIILDDKSSIRQTSKRANEQTVKRVESIQLSNVFLCSTYHLPMTQTTIMILIDWMNEWMNERKETKEKKLFMFTFKIRDINHFVICFPSLFQKKKKNVSQLFRFDVFIFGYFARLSLHIHNSRYMHRYLKNIENP